MKPVLVILATAFLAGISCRKNNEPVLIVSQHEIARGEIIMAKVLNARPGTQFSWRIEGDRYDHQPDTSEVRAWFVKEGKFKVRINLYLPPDSLLYDVLSQEVTVTPKDFTFPAATVSTAGDELHLFPFFLQDSTLAFVASTRNPYQCLSSYAVASDHSVPNAIIKVVFTGVGQSVQCEQVGIPVESVMFTRKRYANGTFPIEITFNNQLYTGTLEITEPYKHFKFTWNHTAGVILAEREFYN